MRLFDLPWLGNGSRVTLGTDYRWDQVRDDQVAGLVQVRIPLDLFGRRPKLAPFERRMLDRIVRDDQVITHVLQTRTPVPRFRERAAFADTGQVVSYFDTVSAGGDLPQTVLRGGANSLINVDGRVVTTQAIDMQPGQRIVGGGTPVPLVGAQTGLRVNFTTPGQRGEVEYFSDQVAVDLADGAVLQNLDITSLNTIALAGHDVNAVEIVDVTLSTVADHAPAAALDDSQARLDRVTITTSGYSSEAISTSGRTRLLLTDSSLCTAGDFAQGIFGLAEEITVLRTNMLTQGDNAHGMTTLGITRFKLIESQIATNGNSHGIDAKIGTTFLVDRSTIVSQEGRAVYAQGTGTDITLNATIRDSTLIAGPGEAEIRFFAGVGDVSGNILGNTLDGGNGEITLDAGGGGTINITQLDPAVNSPNSLDEANGIPQGNVNESGTVNYNQPPPPLP